MKAISQAIGCLLVGLACASAQAQVPGSTPGAVSHLPPPLTDSVDTGKRTPPFVARVGGTDSPTPGGTVRVWAVVERHVVDATPLRLSFQLPSGATLVQVELEVELVDPRSPVIQWEIEIRLGDRIPERDVVITVSQRGVGWGAHAEHAYRFGRPEPDTSPAPLPRGEPIRLGDGTTVRPVLVK